MLVIARALKCDAALALGVRLHRDVPEALHDRLSALQVMLEEAEVQASTIALDIMRHEEHEKHLASFTYADELGGIE